MTGAHDFTLSNERDNEMAWMWDAHHCPRPMPLLSQDSFAYFCAAGISMPLQFVNGYMYLGMRPLPSSIEVPPSPFASARQSWEEHYLPLVQAELELVRAVDLSWSAAELAEAMPSIVARAAYGFGCTMLVMGDAAAALFPLIALLERHFPEDGTMRTMTIAGGHDNDSSGLGEEIRRLAKAAADNPELVDALRTGRLDAVRAAPGASAFLDELDAFLAEYGHSATTWFEVHSIPWREDPSPVFRMIVTALDAPAGRSDSAAARREAMIAECEAALQAADVPAFRALAAGANDYVPIIEGRARWQVAMAGSLRRPMIGLGAKLTEAGALAEPADIFHLRLEELPAAAAGRGPSLADIEQRKADLERWQTLTPPAWLGRPVARETLLRNPMTRHLWGITEDALPGAHEVKGQPASRGVVTGRARVAIRFEDAERLEPGDILVCPFTAPAWTPYFGIAAALVTNTGGALSHAAIVAREYAIPCVVGTGNGTAVIPDGATITVDGSRGIVTIERTAG